MKQVLIFIFFLLIQNLSSKEIREEYFNVDARNEKIPIKVYLQSEAKNKPLIVYSHGLGGSRETKKYLLEHWAKAGFICVSVQHPGSDEKVWKDAPMLKRLKSMKEAAGPKQFLNRTIDVPAVLNQLEKWNKDKKHKLFERIDFTKVAMSGHSFGAITSQAMMGAKYPGGRSFEEKRFKAFLLMSPSPVRGNAKAFESIKLPVMSMTGTKDSSAITPGTGYKERASVYEGMPKGNKYMYVFDEGKHNLFSGPTRFSKKLKEEHVTIQKLSLLFWQAHLLNDPKAIKELASYKASDKDIWQHK